MTFPDHFSTVAAQYAASRPKYPAELFAWLASMSPTRGLAWDAGCGSGQASVALAPHFTRVIASDASAQQIANAEPRANVTYMVAGEVNTALAEYTWAVLASGTCTCRDALPRHRIPVHADRNAISCHEKFMDT